MNQRNNIMNDFLPQPFSHATSPQTPPAVSVLPEASPGRGSTPSPPCNTGGLSWQGRGRRA